MTVKEFYDRIGQDYIEVYERMLGNENLIIHFLQQFCEDETYPALERAVADGDVKNMFLESHTLKGLSANFGLKPLVEKTGVLVELTRGCGSPGSGAAADSAGKEEEAGDGSHPDMENVDGEKITETFAEIRGCYQRIVTQIAKIE
ncbi:MAG: Hpt domain-containing protein [Clostridiales bacterium]|nr:Hpt domain-containing protein [Clostridiales bacterium]